MEKLLNEEYNVLNKIASKSKMDCWFSLGIDKNGNDMVLDLEENKEMPLEIGIATLYDGMTSINDYGLTDEEKNIFVNLLIKLAI